VVQPSLTLAVKAPEQVLICESIPLTLVVTNTGPGVARNVKVAD